MTPAKLHAVVLLGLAAAEETETLATPAPWHIGDAVDPLTPCNLHSARDAQGIADEVSWLDAHLIAALRNTAAAAYAGARDIVERHAPTGTGCCAACCRHPYIEGAGLRGPFPCADYRAAAQVIPNLPEGITRALRAA